MASILLPNSVYVVNVNNYPIGFVYYEEDVEHVLDDIIKKYELASAPSYQTHTYRSDSEYKGIVCGRLRNDLFSYETALYVIEAVPIDQLPDRESLYLESLDHVVPDQY